MFNRIRRAIARTRVRCLPNGRHRRPLTHSRPLASPTCPAPADASTVPLGRAPAGTVHRYPQRGEDVALVRPYLLAWEEQRARTRTVLVASHLPIDAWSVLAGAH
ncbi:hypothetical protein OG849_17800 [Streptomyces cyaneofuscatus]|uniref:ATP-binding protein n=1 Tax=Streptomyces cyaneofuscatus TaxID=66883 RepID=A0ABZ1EY50_9ACTN|nr:hypothetical protein OG849_17800 [Streptomyces cyaneofuscatus]WSD47496.1 hypothetical protein OG857_17605 [Streptomyces cyaneofuscatus]